jgi:mannose-1-phosphate guanylyltransferase
MMVNEGREQQSAVKDLPSKAMILAAGQGLRLKPLTKRIPKCMIPISDKPILEHTIEWLGKYGVNEIIINLYYLPKVVMDYFGNGERWGVRINYSLEEQLLGTAGGVKNVDWFFNGPFFVWYGDNLSTCNLKRLYQFHKAKGGLGTIVLHQRDDVSQSGIVSLDGGDRIVRFQEKPQADQAFSNWVNAGIYVLEPEVLNCIPSRSVSDFAQDVFPHMLTSGQPLYGYRLSADEGFWWIDRHEDLANVYKEWGNLK